MHILISGPGNLGLALAKECDKKVDYSWFSELDDFDDPDAVGVYVGRGRTFESFLKACEERRIPILQCSSDVDLTGLRPGVPVFDVLNAAESVMMFLSQLEALALEIKRRKLTVDWYLTESHQASKKSPPRTALRIMEILNIPKEQVASLRRRKQLHAFHGLQGYIHESGERLEYSCSVEGMEAYAKGLLRMVWDLVSEQQTSGGRAPGVYSSSVIGLRP